MRLFNFFQKPTLTKSPVEKFKAIIISVKTHTEFLMNDDYAGMDSEAAANKVMYQTMDQTMREKLSDEENKKVDKANEVQHVLETLKEEISNGNINDDEIQEILNSKEYKTYTH